MTAVQGKQILPTTSKFRATNDLKEDLLDEEQNVFLKSNETVGMPDLGVEVWKPPLCHSYETMGLADS